MSRQKGAFQYLKQVVILDFRILSAVHNSFSILQIIFINGLQDSEKNRTFRL